MIYYWKKYSLLLNELSKVLFIIKLTICKVKFCIENLPNSSFRFLAALSVFMNKRIMLGITVLDFVLFDHQEKLTHVYIMGPN